MYMTRKKTFALATILLLVLLPVAGSHAAVTDTLEVWSNAMKKNIQVIVILPDITQPFPAVYLLHGYGGDALTWLSVTKPDLPMLADSLQVAFICPDGRNSWYFDSPADPSSRYETFVTQELIEYVDSAYNTIAHRSGRAISGYSMGGHGALWCAIRHQDTYCAAASLSGCVDLTGYPNNWEISKVLGSYDENERLWRESSPINLIQDIGDQLKISLDCGTEDFFSNDNLRFHNMLDAAGIEHCYYATPGEHTHDYWNKALDRALAFIAEAFAANLGD